MSSSCHTWAQRVLRLVDQAVTAVLAFTDYDEEHAVPYVRMLDADAEGADWREVSRIVLHIDPDHHPDRAQRAFDSHLARAKWVARHGHRELLRSGWPR